MEEMDRKAKRGRIYELESKMVDHNKCCGGVVTVCGAETGQHVEVSHRIVIQAPTKLNKQR
jgi:hypothetical protein